MKALILIPARGGSKGILGKNIKELNGKPLICYTIDVVRSFLKEINLEVEICVSTDDFSIQKVVNDYGIETPFIRPEYLSTDASTTVDVIHHSLNFYKENNIIFDCIILLQPTSPFRRLVDLINAWKLLNQNSETDAVVSVFDSGANPYYNLVEEIDGYIKKSKNIADLTRRQDAPKVYQLNGAIYIFKVDSFISKSSILNMGKIKLLEMPLYNSIDIDHQSDWDYCEYLLHSNLISINSLLNP